MNAFAEKSDTILQFLRRHGKTPWSIFYTVTGIKKDDALLKFLCESKRYIECTDTDISITEEGKGFVSKTSFVEQRNKAAL